MHDHPALNAKTNWARDHVITSEVWDFAAQEGIVWNYTAKDPASYAVSSSFISSWALEREREGSKGSHAKDRRLIFLVGQLARAVSWPLPLKPHFLYKSIFK